MQQAAPEGAAPTERHDVSGRPWRVLLTFAGLICVLLAVAGIILPLLPTTPFLLLAAACFSRSSPRLDHWLHHNRAFGRYLSRYRRGEGIPRVAKISIISLLWLSLAASAFFVVPDRLWPLRLVLALIGLGVSIHVLRIKSALPQSETVR